MGSVARFVCFIERATLISCLLSVAPFLLRVGLDKLQGVYLVDYSYVGRKIVKLLGRVCRVPVSELHFKYEDVRDAAGNQLSLRIRYHDLFEVQQWIIESEDFIAGSSCGENRYQSLFLKKEVVNFTHNMRSAVFRALYLVQVARWKQQSDGLDGLENILFLDRRLWFREIQRYGKQNGVRVVSVLNAPFGYDIKSLLLQFGGAANSFVAKQVYFHALVHGWAKTCARSVGNALFRTGRKNDGSVGESITGSTTKKLCVDYYGHLNLSTPEKYSDLFFWQQSSFPGENIIVTYKIPGDPLDDEKLSELRKYRITPIVLSPEASQVENVYTFLHWPSGKTRGLQLRNRERITGTKERRWLHDQVCYYSNEHTYWVDFFASLGVRIHLTWQKYTSLQPLLAGAIRSVGGIAAVYQRSFEELPTTRSMVSCDLVFGFSPWNAEIEQQNGSVIPYHVAVGYVGDHRFELLKDPAQRIRKKLQRAGAEHIIAYFDEVSVDDGRWLTGHSSMQEDYVFWLEKVCSDPRLGLILKPKTPSTLRKRLGAVAEVLKRAEATGRCYVVEGGALQSSFPPALAALAADVVIHGGLYAATAGLEAALAGTPTLLMDKEGFVMSRFYEEGSKRTVFNLWDDLWHECVLYFQGRSQDSMFGSWSPILHQIDPFRDGRAAERIGTYLSWCMEGLEAGLDRETVLADAADRYCRIWGHDKITEVPGKDIPC